MTNPEIDRLLEERSLVRESFDDEQVAGYWAKAVASFQDAQADGMSPNGAFQLAYTAALQATLAVLAAHGLRVRAVANHYTSFYALQKLSAEMREFGLAFDGLRRTRHESVYEPVDDPEEMARLVVQARRTVLDALPALRSAIVGVRPGIANRLP